MARPVRPGATKPAIAKLKAHQAKSEKRSRRQKAAPSDAALASTLAIRPVALTADRSEIKLHEAALRLAARRLRDLLPGKIVTKRLVLRAPIRGDVPDLTRLADNKTIADKLARLPHPYSRADAIAFVEIYAQRADERPYAITLDGQFIGVVGMTFFNDGEPPELGYWLGEPYWGQGFASEAVRGLIDAAFATGQFQRLKSRALADNRASLGVLEKNGFKRLREGVDATGNSAGKATVYLTLDRPRWM